jgi:hypothetical protein
MPSGSGLIVDFATKHLFDSAQRGMNGGGTGAAGVVRHWMLGLWLRKVAASNTEDAGAAAGGRRRGPASRRAGGYLLTIKEDARAASCAARAAAHAAAPDCQITGAFRTLRSDQMAPGSSFCTARRDDALRAMQESKFGGACAASPTQGRYALVWPPASATGAGSRTYLLVTDILVMQKAGVGGVERVVLAGRPLHVVAESRFVVAQLLQSSIAVDLSLGSSLEQVSVRALDGQGLTAICPQYTLLVPSAAELAGKHR